MGRINFNRPLVSEAALENIREVLANGHLSGNGPFTKACQDLLAEQLGASRVLITHSCTAALEMSVLLAGIEPGDEVIMPSFTFVSTANAVALRGGVPVFVDIRPDTLNIDERLIEAAVTEKTKAISVVHYAGVACEMDDILAIAKAHDLAVMEDAAQAMEATYRGRPLGAIGDFGAISFHETKNVISGEGGALVIRDPDAAARAEIIWEKGTNRAEFMRGEADKYTWIDIGSSFLPSELIAAVLLTQVRDSSGITRRRLAAWSRYFEAFAALEAEGLLRRPWSPDHVEHNGHIFYLLLPDQDRRDALIDHLRGHDIQAVFHYIPLHSAPAGRKFGRVSGTMDVTDATAAQLVRLPLHADMDEAVQQRVIAAVLEFFG